MGGNAVMRLVVFGLYILHSCCYQVTIIIRDAKTWTEAQNYCREKYNDLITINSEEEANMLSEILGRSDEQFWTGLYGNFDKFVWSMVPAEFDEEGQNEYTKWYTSQPNENKGIIMCTNIALTGVWSDSPCDIGLPFVCYDASENKYIFVPETKAWISAQMYCREHHTDLATIRTEAENQDIAGILQEISWMGYYRLSWMWSDGQSRHINSFNNWGAQPARVQGYCTTTTDIKWTEWSCGERFYFICSETMKKHMRIKVVLNTSDSSMNLEEIQDAILQKFNETLKENQISEQVALKWIEQPDEKIYQKTEE